MASPDCMLEMLYMRGKALSLGGSEIEVWSKNFDPRFQGKSRFNESCVTRVAQLSGTFRRVALSGLRIENCMVSFESEISTRRRGATLEE